MLTTAPKEHKEHLTGCKALALNITPLLSTIILLNGMHCGYNLQGYGYNLRHS